MSMSDNDIDRNLAFDSNLQAGRDDDDGRISGNLRPQKTARTATAEFTTTTTRNRMRATRSSTPRRHAMLNVVPKSGSFCLRAVTQEPGARRSSTPKEACFKV